jgi:hypothetical protein
MHFVPNKYLSANLENTRKIYIMNRGSGLAQYWVYTCAHTTPSHIDWPDGGSEIRIGASRGIVMLRSRSIPIEANHYINILYYFLYLTLSSSTPRDAFLTGSCHGGAHSPRRFVTVRFAVVVFFFVLGIASPELSCSAP